MINMRMLNETSTGEPEQDANSALIELDKGLRSTKIGEQCEAIVRYPKLFEKYPFPILINSSLLKLADVFRVGTNFLRVWVLRVFQQSEKHLDKILNVDEFVKRIYSVMHSNDPIAKALTLRTLGSVARIIPERKQVHHSIRKSLDCHDLVQVEAAIFAAQMFAAQSKQFAIFMCSKISDMIRGQATPAKMKLQLIPILQYMHHDISTAAMANGLCLELLESYPAVEFVHVTLSASTTLASATLINVSDQVTLLLRYIRQDPRASIKTHALKLLHSLAGKGAHLWPRGALDQLINYATLLKDEAGNVELLIKSLHVMEVLSKSPVTCEANIDEGSPLISLCSRACYSPNPAVAVKAVTILARIARYGYQEDLPLSVALAEQLVCCLDSLITLLALEDQHLAQLKVCLQLTVQLCEARPSLCAGFVEAIGATLQQTAEGARAVALCEALGAIGSLADDALLPLLPELLARLQRSEHAHGQVMLCTLLFQTLGAGYEWSAESLRAVAAASQRADPWSRYRIARGAARYGHHQLASQLFRGLKERVASEQPHFWLLGLELLTGAEGRLSEAAGLPAAVAQYAAACGALRAAAPGDGLAFACEYAALRGQLLRALLQLLHSCRALCTAPPYAIAAHEAHTAKDELQRYGRVTGQLRKCVVQLRDVADGYARLRAAAFDADPGSLDNLAGLRELCLLLARGVQRVCGGPIPPAPPARPSGTSSESRRLAACCARLRELAPAAGPGGGVSHLRVGVLLDQVRLLASSRLRLPLPRFFFQALQSTSVKLSLSPQPRVQGEPLAVPQGSQLAVRVEGVLRHGGRPALFRSVAAVGVSVCAAPPARAASARADSCGQQEVACELRQTVVPSRDFFACEFLLALGQGSAAGGQYQVTASASIIDQSGNSWTCAPRSLLHVRVHEEPSRKKLS